MDFPPEITYNFEDLKRFILQDPHPVIAFYGGEACLRPELLTRMIDEIPCDWYTLQTNGTMLDNLPTEYLDKFQSILVSLDGDEAITDLNREQGHMRKLCKHYAISEIVDILGN